MEFLPPCESAASHYRVGLVSFGSGCVLVFQGGVFECSSRMKGNFQVRFLEGRVPAMAPGYSTNLNRYMGVAVLWRCHPLARFHQLKALGRIGHSPNTRCVILSETKN